MQKSKTKEGKKLKKKQQQQQQQQQQQLLEEDPDCDPPAPKKKKKKDKAAADQENGHLDEACDMNGNNSVVETPKQKTKKNKDDTEVSPV